MNRLGALLLSFPLLAGAFPCCGAPVYDWTNGQITITWSQQPPPVVGVEEELVARAQANYDPQFPPGKEWEYTSGPTWSGWTWNFKGGGTGTHVDNGNSSTATFWYYQPSSALNDKSVDAGVTVTATVLDYGPDGVKGTDDDVIWNISQSQPADPWFTVGAITNVSIGGATQNNVTGANNWAVVQSPDYQVSAEVTTTPNLEEVWQAIDWTGNGTGDAGTVGGLGTLNTRFYSAAASRKWVIHPVLRGTSVATRYVWVLWATGQIRASGNRSVGNSKHFPPGTGGDKLGPLTDEDDNIIDWEVVGKIEGVFTLWPTGVHGVISRGLDIKRWLVYRYCVDGQMGPERSKPDDERNDDEDLVPDADEKIYVLDVVAMDVDRNGEAYHNFTEWLEWNGQKCSTDYPWHYQAWVNNDLDAEHKPKNDDTELNDVDTKHITIPEKAHYPEPQ